MLGIPHFASEELLHPLPTPPPVPLPPLCPYKAVTTATYACLLAAALYLPLLQHLFDKAVEPDEDACSP